MRVDFHLTQLSLEASRGVAARYLLRSFATLNTLVVKVLGEALGHVDGEDGVLVKVYDDIQTELR